uniref:Secreted protein n=1 Tax=Oryza brachyantha TaxID=4533 RepID=J3N9N2_ORYBR
MRCTQVVLVVVAVTLTATRPLPVETSRMTAVAKLIMPMRPSHRSAPPPPPPPPCFAVCSHLPDSDVAALEVTRSTAAAAFEQWLESQELCPQNSPKTWQNFKFQNVIHMMKLKERIGNFLRD